MLTKYQKKCLMMCRDYKISNPDNGEKSFAWAYIEDKDGNKLSDAYGIYNKDYFYHICLIKPILGKSFTLGVLLHEVGHILYNHLNSNSEEDFELASDIAVRVGYTDDMILALKLNFNNFENICMDLEVNSKILTISDIVKINEYVQETYGADKGLMVPSKFKCEVRDKYTDYYQPVLEEMFDQYQKLGKSISDILKELASAGMIDLNEVPADDSGGEVVTVEDLIESETGEKLSHNVDGEDDGEGFGDCDKPDSNGSKSKSAYKLGYEDPDTLLTQFIWDICSRCRNVKYDQNFDSMKHHNKGTRPNNDGLLYTSRKRKMNISEYSHFKLGIILDVSSSQHAINRIFTKVLGKVCSMIKNTFKQALMQVWTCDLLGEYDLKKEIPSTIPHGSGTRLGKGIVSLSNKGFNTILMISDLLIAGFEDDLKDLDPDRYIDLYVVDTMSPCRSKLENPVVDQYFMPAIDKYKSIITLKGRLDLSFFDGENGTVVKAK